MMMKKTSLSLQCGEDCIKRSFKLLKDALKLVDDSLKMFSDILLGMVGF